MTIMTTMTTSTNSAHSKADTWTVAEAKAKFSAVLEQAASRPQTVTRNGRIAAVIVAPDEWDRKARRSGNLAEFLAASPLRGSGLRVRRSRERPRKVKL